MNDSRLNSVREVRYEHSREFAGLLHQLGVSLLVSTYQAGKLVVLGTRPDGIVVSLHNFEQAMGIAVGPDRLAVGSKTQVWQLAAAPDLAAHLQDGHDACFLTRSSHVTDEIHVHEMEWCDEELWVVNTRFSCLCTLQSPFSFVPRWRPPFISALAAEDRCHLNGLVTQDGKPQYVTAMSETDTADGWREVKATAGCLMDVPANETVARGFAMPHSPRLYGDRLWVLDSGRGHLATVDPQQGTWDVVSAQPGYTRGLAFVGPYAFVGLSKIRETSTFGGVPLADRRDQLKCAVAVVDLRNGERVAYFEFLSGVTEIFDVRVLPQTRCPYVAGPFELDERGGSIWYVPAPNSETAVTSETGAEDARSLVERGRHLAEQDRWGAAVACFRRALALQSDFLDAHVNLGLTLQYLGKWEAAEEQLREALRLDPNSRAAHLNFATTQFRQGELQEGWKEYEWRKRPTVAGDAVHARIRMAPDWQGESLAGRHLLVYNEQGIGDEVMFASCLPDLQDDAGRITWAADPRLISILQRSFPKVDVVAASVLEDASIECDAQVAAGSLPLQLRRSLDQFPDRKSYLIADPAAQSGWTARLAKLPGRSKIGISWRGGGEPVERRRRSSVLADWLPLLQVPDVTWVNLQYGDCSDELRQLQQDRTVQIHDFDDLDPLLDLDGFADLISALDLVISVDNSTIHLAGALGVPTWALLSDPSSSYWRWFGHEETCFWYPSVHLIRRPISQPWPQMLAPLAIRLSNLGHP